MKTTVTYQVTEQLMKYVSRRAGLVIDNTINIAPADLTLADFKAVEANLRSAQGVQYTDEKLQDLHRVCISQRASVQAAWNCMTGGIKNFNAELERVRRDFGLI